METYGSLVTELRSRLDEATARQWTDTALIRWVYEGALDISRRTESLQTTAEVDAFANQQEYDLPTDVVRVHRVEYAPEDDTRRYNLEYRDFHAMDAVWWSQQTVTVNIPVYWTMWGAVPNLKLVVYPTPQSDGTFKVFYYRLSDSPYTDDDDAPIVLESDQLLQTCDLPQGWHMLAVDFAEYMALRRDAQPRWIEAKQMYEERLADLYATAIRWTDQAGMITTLSGSVMQPRWIWDEGYW